MDEDVRGRGIKYLSSHVHVKYTKHKAYTKVDLISVVNFNSSAAVHHLGKKGE